MKNIILLASVLLLSNVAISAPELTFGPPICVSPTNGSKQVGSFYLYYASGPSDSSFGPLLIWQSVLTGEIIDVKSVAELDKVAKVEMAQLDVDVNEATWKSSLLVILGTFASSQGSILLEGRLRKQYIQSLEKKLPSEKFSQLRTMMCDLDYHRNEGNWHITFCLITKRGALEQRSFSGSVNPFSITQSTSSVLAEDHSIPAVPFVPTP